MDEGVKGLKIGLVKEGFSFKQMEEDVAKLVKESAIRLTDAGASVEDTSIPIHDDGINKYKYYKPWRCCVYNFYLKNVKRNKLLLRLMSHSIICK